MWILTFIVDILVLVIGKKGLLILPMSLTVILGLVINHSVKSGHTISQKEWIFIIITVLIIAALTIIILII